MKIIPFLLFIILAAFAPKTEGNLYQLAGDVVSFLIEITRIQPYLLSLYPAKNRPKEEHFDFIIIGSGPSGSALANRLTENPNVKVLLLESGEEPSLIVDIPIVAGALEFTSYNYNYKSQRQPNFCTGCPNGVLQWPHGNVLGGSSVINYMIYVRGNPADYDKWAALGNPGWSYEDILPYFKKLEDSRVSRSDEAYRGKGGNVAVSDVPWRSGIVDVYVNACTEAGHEYVDYNGRRQLGVSYIQSTTRNGARWHAEKAYLRQARSRKNLKIQVKSRATKILIDPRTKTAYGVEYYYEKKRHVVYAKKEVISSAGSLNSPQLLMLSGVGPKDHLEELGIPVIQDLPVGKKMYDHATFPLIMFQVDKPLVINAVTAALNPFNYIGVLFGKGLFTSIGGVEAITYVKTNISTDPDPLYPDVELLMVGGALNTDFGIIFRKIFNVKPEIYNKIFLPLFTKYVYMVTPVVLHPKSFGWIKLNSSNPWDAPLFYPNYFSDPEDHDVKTFIAAFRELERINSMPSMQKIGSRIVSIPVPGCESHRFDSDEYWACAVRTVIGSYYHQVATCKMGPEGDPEAVVDHKLRVHGVKKLRVVDTSVIPIPPATHNVGPAYAIGEKAADIIKNCYGI
ncbi:unnamed protein product [Phyllotreta striolata]|uniref:Glucose-methanol-choline oxidoreductase N-terminal domain-containing protein n=1 Tax=Phyllotreta striolata TaxID=444603 RepID=A0A9N9TU06_PHYSR|nr:unnamed protein product [Phyllotreta striolata]